MDVWHMPGLAHLVPHVHEAAYEFERYHNRPAPDGRIVLLPYEGKHKKLFRAVLSHREHHTNIFVTPAIEGSETPTFAHEITHMDFKNLVPNQLRTPTLLLLDEGRAHLVDIWLGRNGQDYDAAIVDKANNYIHEAGKRKIANDIDAYSQFIVRGIAIVMANNYRTAYGNDFLLKAMEDPLLKIIEERIPEGLKPNELVAMVNSI